MYKPWDDLVLRCWICGRSPITRHATEQDSRERKYDTSAAALRVNYGD